MMHKDFKIKIFAGSPDQMEIDANIWMGGRDIEIYKILLEQGALIILYKYRDRKNESSHNPLSPHS